MILPPPPNSRRPRGTHFDACMTPKALQPTPRGVEAKIGMQESVMRAEFRPLVPFEGFFYFSRLNYDMAVLLFTGTMAA